ncbi:NSA1 [[Candida] subhashii]|uniref:NSA1 n=1 Tax=[Candida] subhashii TaxID=561895 RepID=A0A8J5UW80_9ASCO|nr:NSA1 [[Candida] subhashii]KAG7661459.1 NSA1 [[Candida] subhashii]
MKFLISSDDTGAAKEVVCVRGTDTSKQTATQPRSIKNYFTHNDVVNSKSRIMQMINFNSEYIIASRLGGTIAVYEVTEEAEEEEAEKNGEEEKGNEDNKYKLLHEYQVPIEDEKDKPIALIKIEILDSVIVAYESSKVFLIHINEKFDFEPLEIPLPSNKPISAFTINPDEENVCAFGGNENDLQIVRLFESKVNRTIFKKKQKDYLKVFTNPSVIYKAKNVKNDHLDLRVPVWISNILFFHHEQEGYKLVTSTRYGQVRIYDTKHGRRPIQDFQICEKPIVTLTFANDDQTEIIITDTHHLMARHSLVKIDERAFKTHSASAGDIIKPVGKLLGKYSQGGNTGATFAVEIMEDIVATAGLDRYLRVFDLESREMLAKVYVGVEVSSIVILDDEDEEAEEEQAAEGVKDSKVHKKRKRVEHEESDDEELWNQLDSNEAKKSKQ